MSKLLLDEYPLIVIPSLAKAVGINGAIILQQLHYWLQKSKNVEDGEVWRYQTYDDWSKEMPWLSAVGVRKILKKLEQDGYIITGNYNKRKMDKTIWYRIAYNHPIFKGKSMCYKVSVDAIQSIRPCDTKLGTLPETTTETTTDIKNIKKDLLDSFTGFYEVYPRHTARAAALKAWIKLEPIPALVDTIIKAVGVQKDTVWAEHIAKGAPEFIPYPATYLNGHRWEDEITVPEAEADYGVMNPRDVFEREQSNGNIPVKYDFQAWDRMTNEERRVAIGFTKITDADTKIHASDTEPPT